MSLLKKISCSLILLSLLAAPLSCTQPTDNTDPTTTTTKTLQQNEPTVTVPTGTEKLLPDLDEYDFDGAEINFLVMSKNRVTTNYSMEIFSEEETGDPIYDAVYKRNTFIEDKYNVKITESPSVNLPGDARRSILASDSDYDVLMMSITDINQFVLDGSLLNLWDVPGIDLNKPWWNQRINDDMSIFGNLYFTAGDLNIMDNNATWVTLFNKQLFKDNGLEMPYKMVLENKWTIDRLHEYSKLTSDDINGDGKMDESDTYGLISETYNTYALLVASGGRIITLDKDGAPELSLNTPKVVDILDKILPVQWDKNNVLITEDYSSKYTNAWAEVNRVMFREGRGLCYITGILSATLLRDMDHDFGIIPLPKFDEAQEEYYTTIHTNNASTISIPSTNPNAERTGIILEALSAESMYTLTPAYYDVTLNVKVIRDDESTKMLDIIFDSVVYDPGDIFKIGNLTGMIRELTKGSTNEFVSRYNAIEDVAKNDLSKIIDNFSK